MLLAVGQKSIRPSVSPNAKRTTTRREGESCKDIVARVSMSPAELNVAKIGGGSVGWMVGWLAGQAGR